MIDLIEGDLTIWEQEPLQTLAKSGELSAFHHTGFWQPMDTLRDKSMLEISGIQVMPLEGLELNVNIFWPRSINDFWKNKKVLVTGHTGFKVLGSLLLLHLGCDVYGFSCSYPSEPFV